MNKHDFHFELPRELIAQQPLPERGDSRLLVLDVPQTRWQDRGFRDLPQYLRTGDLLVLNDTRVIPARLFGRKPTGGQVEIMVERVLDQHRLLAQLRVSKKPATGSRIGVEGGGEFEVLGREDGFFELAVCGGETVSAVLTRAGHMPLPPYIERADTEADAERYQTVYAREPGAVAAPTAGLHFDQAMLQRLEGQGVDIGHVTLHVGAGTFQPMRAERIEDHHMHSEWLQVDAALVDKITATRARGGRVVAVGTTVVRALESASRGGELKPFTGETDIFIYPGIAVRSVDALVTNFHLPESTLLMLVSAMAGRELVLAAYRHAVAERYRFFSYGDAMLILPHGQT